MFYCSSKNLTRKTLASYEKTLKLFIKYLKDTFEIEEVKKLRKSSQVIFGNRLSTSLKEVNILK
ncbi:hypothetical protein [Paenibacillus antarcticus]|uniref:hypothetical protein n=1 Tax=Paenibacillus antarcticus TaxID=253703 RepID=UPI003B84B047